jgi:hypothetical protein
VLHAPVGAKARELGPSRSDGILVDPEDDEVLRPIGEASWDLGHHEALRAVPAGSRRSLACRASTPTGWSSPPPPCVMPASRWRSPDRHRSLGEEIDLVLAVEEWERIEFDLVGSTFWRSGLRGGRGHVEPRGLPGHAGGLLRSKGLGKRGR